MAKIPYPKQYDDDFMNTFKLMIDVINDRGDEILSSEAVENTLSIWLTENKFKPKEAVSTFDELPASPELKELRGVLDENAVYVWNGSEWIKQSSINFDGLSGVKDRLGDTMEVINVKHHGAVGDGVTDDYVAIQGAIALAETTGRNVYIPSSTYKVGDTLRTSHDISPHWREGIRIFGDGSSSILEGRGADVVDYSNLNTASDGAVFALHNGNNIVENIKMTRCTVGVFLGQHPDTTEHSSVSFNTIENVWVERVGTGILMVHALGNNYNRFKKIHVLGCQIGVHLGKGTYLDQFNNNRNTFEDIRVSYGWIGYMVEQADGCALNNLYAENLVEHPNVIGNQPTQLPTALEGKKTAVLVLDGQYNLFDKVGVENCEWHLYSVGFRTTFDNMMIHDDAASRVKVMFPDLNRLPLSYKSDSFISPFMQYQPDAGTFFQGSNGLAFTSRVFDMNYHWQSVDLSPLSQQISSIGAGRTRIRRLAGMFSWFVNMRFSLEGGVAENDDIKINLPFGSEINLNSYFDSESSSTLTHSFPVYVGVAGSVDIVRGRFSTGTETAGNNGVPYVVIPAPQHLSGWNTSSSLNNINFELHYYA